MIVVIFEVTGQPPQMDGFPDDVRIFNKNGFVRVDTAKGEKMLACYNPARIVAIRRIDNPVIKPDENLNQADATETLHTGNGTKEQ